MMKNKIIQTLKAIAKYIGSTVLIWILLSIILIVLVRTYNELVPEQFQIARNILLLLLCLLVLVPIKFDLEFFRRAIDKLPKLIPKMTKAQLYGLGWLVMKLFFWGLTCFIAFSLVYKIFDGVIFDPYFSSYPYSLSSDIQHFSDTVFWLGFLRICVTHFLPEFNYQWILSSIKKEASNKKISFFAAITSLVLAIFSAFIIGNFFLGNTQTQISWEPKPYNDSHASLTIEKFLPEQGKVSGVFQLNTSLTENNEALQKNYSLIFEYTKLAVNRENDNVYSTVDVDISGSDYYFPFNQYEVKYLGFYPEGADFKEPFNFYVSSKLPSIVVEKNYNLSFSTGPYSFYIKYSYYYKLLVITMGIAFLIFFVSVILAKSRNQIIELAIGTFAALIAVRGFLIPGNISSPIFIDQLFLLYIILFLIVFLLRLSQLNWEK